MRKIQMWLNSLNGSEESRHERNYSPFNFNRLLHLAQGDSLAGRPELTIIKQAIIYRRKQLDEYIRTLAVCRWLCYRWCWDWFPCAWRDRLIWRSMLANVVASIAEGVVGNAEMARTWQAGITPELQNT
jgi:hypothetical protein